MRLHLACAAIVLGLSTHAFAQAPAVPKEASDFHARAEGCVHFGGEVPENPKTRAEKQRAAQVQKKIKELCSGNRARIAALKKKFAGNKVALGKIGEGEKLLQDAGTLE